METSFYDNYARPIDSRRGTTFIEVDGRVVDVSNLIKTPPPVARKTKVSLYPNLDELVLEDRKLPADSNRYAYEDIVGGLRTDLPVRHEMYRSRSVAVPPRLPTDVPIIDQQPLTSAKSKSVSYPTRPLLAEEFARDFPGVPCKSDVEPCVSSSMDPSYHHTVQAFAHHSIPDLSVEERSYPSINVDINERYLSVPKDYEDRREIQVETSPRSYEHDRLRPSRSSFPGDQSHDSHTRREENRPSLPRGLSYNLNRSRRERTDQWPDMSSQMGRSDCLVFSSSRSLFGKDEWETAEPNAYTVEVMPGTDLPLRGSYETRRAIRAGKIARIDCMDCSAPLSCMEAAEFVICPICRSVSPIAGFGEAVQEGTYGVALGFTSKTGASEAEYIDQGEKDEDEVPDYFKATKK